MKTFTLTDDDAEKLGTILTDCRGVTHYDSLVNSYFNGGNTMTTTTELLEAAVNMAETHKAAADLANATVGDLGHRLATIRNVATVALYDHERITVAALADALAEILEIARGEK